MKTPRRMTLAEFREAIRQFLSLHCISCDRRLACPNAIRRSSISARCYRFTTSNSQMRASRWMIRRGIFSVPYCPRCEIKPNEQGCVHLPHTLVPKAS